MIAALRRSTIRRRGRPGGSAHLSGAGGLGVSIYSRVVKRAKSEGCGMGGLQSGGGTSAVAASAHAGCERFRLTDPFITRRTRKALAAYTGHPDSSAGIPEARWTRAMTFESLVHSESFVSELLTKTVGQLDLARPKGVRRRHCHGTVAKTVTELALAHIEAESSGEATMVTALAVPYLNLENVPDTTPVQPDFAIVCP